MHESTDVTKRLNRDRSLFITNQMEKIMHESDQQVFVTRSDEGGGGGGSLSE